MIRLPLPTAEELETAEAAFSEAELVDQMITAAESPSIPASYLLAYARGNRRDRARIAAALLTNPALRRLCRNMAATGAIYTFPEAIAASSTEFPERRTAGCRISVLPSRARVGAYYLVIELEGDGTAAPGLLVVCDPEDRMEQLSLPPADAGIIQVMIDDASGIPAMLRNPKSAIFLR